MRILQDLFNGKGYIDGITVINLEGEILFTAKLNGKLSNREDSQQLLGQKFFDIYENLDPLSSSTYRAMELGVPLYVEDQLLETRGQEAIRIDSLSIPIKSGGRVVGAVDLSVQNYDGLTVPLSEPDSLDPGSLPIHRAQKLSSEDLAGCTMEDIIAVDERMEQGKN